MNETQLTHQYKKIIHLAIESSAIYSVATLFNAINSILGIINPIFGSLAVYGINQYGSAFATVMTVSVVQFISEN